MTEGAPRNSQVRALRTWAHIDLEALEANYRSIKAFCSPDTAVLCVIKANAYGHGAVEVGRKLESIGVRHFGVATIDEGKELRENGIGGLILVLSGVLPWDEVSPVVEYELTPAVTTFEMLERIAAFDGGSPVKVHIKIDTGMGRMGFTPAEIEKLAEKVATSRGVEVEGLMSHFASSDKHDEYGIGQVEAFRAALSALKEKGIEPRLAHIANSAAVCTFPEAHFDMVRAGIMLYGSYPDPSLEPVISLRPVMKWSSRIASVRLFEARTSLSYGRTFITERMTRVAYVPIGYADGYPRKLSNRGSVLIRGRRCRVLGTICMEWILVDITGFADVGVGEEVVLLGDGDGGRITADEIAGQTGTIPYEILCGVSRRVPRIHG